MSNTCLESIPLSEVRGAKCGHSISIPLTQALQSSRLRVAGARGALQAEVPRERRGCQAATTPHSRRVADIHKATQQYSWGPGACPRLLLVEGVTGMPTGWTIIED